MYQFVQDLFDRQYSCAYTALGEGYVLDEEDLPFYQSVVVPIKLSKRYSALNELKQKRLKEGLTHYKIFKFIGDINKMDMYFIESILEKHHCGYADVLWDGFAEEQRLKGIIKELEAIMIKNDTMAELV
jgi:hypothetical protein